MADEANRLPEGKQSSMIGQCADEACGWRWPVAYLPMPLDRAAGLMQAARCPACGGTKVLCG